MIFKKLRSALFVLLLAAASFPAVAQQRAISVASAPVYMPDVTHAKELLPPGVLAWDATQKREDATNGQPSVRFTFALTNIATRAAVTLLTNHYYVTNFTLVTNTGFWAAFSGRKYSHVATCATNQAVTMVTNSIVPDSVVILDVHPSCGCTTADVPPRPWLLPPGTNTLIPVTVNIAGKSGIVPKSIHIVTDHGFMDLMVIVNILPPPAPRPLTEAERAQGLAMAKVDRQAVFKGDCASCHNRNLTGKYGMELFQSACSICHEANPRATMVPDLHNLKDPTSEEFWRAWITSGKAGTLMPAFSTPQGGPLTDLQIASLAAWLNQRFPSHASPAPAK